MTYVDQYRYITGAEDEGPDFQRMLKRVGRFWQDIMGAQVVHDAPGVMIKHARDWEYPWVQVKSRPAGGKRMLDCGAGYSPVPFLWAESGAEAHAIDRDALICSRLAYPFHVAGHIAVSALRLPLVVWRRTVRRRSPEAAPESNNDCPAMQHAVRLHGRPKARGGPLRRAGRFIWSGLYNRYPMVRRIWKPDTWGPVSPHLLKKYGVTYRNGDLTRLPYEDGSFDTVSCISVLEHMPVEAQARGIGEMARVTRPGGQLIITYDKYTDDEDLTDRFIETAGMEPDELVYLRRPHERMIDKTLPDIVGMCLVKPPASS